MAKKNLNLKNQKLNYKLILFTSIFSLFFLFPCFSLISLQFNNDFISRNQEFGRKGKSSGPDGVGYVNCIETAFSGTSISIGDIMIINYNDMVTSNTTSVWVNLTHFGGVEKQPLFDDGTNGDLFAGDGNWTLRWTILDPYPHGIDQASGTLKMNASDGSGIYDIDTPTILNSGFTDIDTISPTIESLYLNFYNISQNKRTMYVGITFSETMYYSTQNHNDPTIEFTPDLSSLYSFYDNGWTDSNTVYNITLSFTSDPEVYFNIDMNISDVIDFNHNPLRNGHKLYEDLLNMDTAIPNNPNNFNSYSHQVNGYSNNNTISLSWEEPYDLGSGINGYLIKWADYVGAYPAEAFDYYTTLQWNSSVELEDGDWYFNVRTMDNFGNWNDTVKSIGPFIIDTYSPDIYIISPSGGSTFGATAPDFEVHIEEDNNDTFWYSLDGGITNTTFTDNTGQIISQSVWDSLPDGAISIRFYARDLAGNIGSSSLLTINKDTSTTPPPGPKNGISGYPFFYFIAIIGLTSIITIYKIKSKNKKQ